MEITSKFYLSLLYNKYVIPITYSDKMLNVINDLEFKGDFISIKNIEKLKAEDIDFFSSKNKLNVEKSRKNSEKHFIKLDMYLGNKLR